MNMRHRNRTSKFNYKKLILICLSIVLSIIVFLIIKYFAYSNPVGNNQIFAFLTTRKDLVNQLNTLKEEKARMDASISYIALLKEENEKLKTELNRENYSKGILASVLFPAGRSLYDTFIIDAGAREGITLGQTVKAFDAIALGTVTDVREHDSTVLLFSNPQKETQARVSGSDVAVTMIGRGMGEYEARMPRDIHFEIGQVISLQSTTPLVLGVIQKISTDPRDPFLRILAKAPVNLQNLKWVIVQ